MAELWFHIDMDAFFAAIEQNDHPEFRGKPLIVGALPGHRGVVSTCSYEARKFGVHSAMPVSEAYRLCPQGIFVLPRMERYQAVSQVIMGIFNLFTPKLIQVSVDEAFLDMSGTRRLLGHPEEIARSIKAQVLAETGLTLSIGIAPNKFLAKIASAYQKPNGLTIIPENGEADFILSIPLEKLWGLGKKTRERLQGLGITSCADLKSQTHANLRAQLGNGSGDFLYSAIRGIDPGIYEGKTESHSISSETTFEHDVLDIAVLEAALFELCFHVMFRLRAEQAASQVLCVKFRYADFSTFNVQKKLGQDLLSIEECYKISRQLFLQRWDHANPIRLLGFGFDQVHPAHKIQASLFEDIDERRDKVEKAVQDLHGRYQKGVVAKASLLKNDRHR